MEEDVTFEGLFEGDEEAFEPHADKPAVAVEPTPAAPSRPPLSAVELDRDARKRTEESAKKWPVLPEFMFEKWFPMIADLTFPSQVLPIDAETCIALRDNCACFGVSSIAGLDKVIESNERLLALERSINGCLVGLSSSSGGFVKLSTRSAKDAVLCDLSRVKPLFKTEVERRFEEKPFGGSDSLEQIAEDNWHIFFRAVSRAVRVENGRQALHMFLSSRRAFHDLSWAIEKGGEMKVIVRAWREINPEYEFRAFVFHGRLTSCTQYTENVFVSEMFQRREQIKREISSFWEKEVRARLAGFFPNDDYTIDFALNPTTVEINDPPPMAGTALYHLEDQHDRQIFENGLPDGSMDIRIIDRSPITPADARDAIPNAIWSWIMNCRDKLLERKAKEERKKH